MKKHPLAVLLAMGAPKSQPPPDSEDNPDQGGADDTEDATDGTESDSGASDEGEEGEDMLDIPTGFKPPSNAADGGMFTTTIRAQVVDGKLKVLAVGDMPLKGGEDEGAQTDENSDEDESAAPSDEQPDQSQQPALSAEGAAYVKRKKDADAAKKAFQPNR